MWKRRCPHDLIANTLKLAEKPVAVTDIYFGVKFSGKRYEAYIRRAFKLRLLEKSHGKLKTTAKGHEFLEHYTKMQRLLGEGE